METQAVNTKYEKSKKGGVSAGKEELSLWSFSLAGIISGLGTGVLNNVWIMAFPYLTNYDEKSIPHIHTISVTILSLVPVILAALAYYFLCFKGIAKGTKIYLTVGISIFLASLYVPLFPESIAEYLPENLLMGEAFTLFTMPMHIIAAFFALVIIPYFVKVNH